jgi:predicted lipoprotein with Yx(FWY)xxD motif
MRRSLVLLLAPVALLAAACGSSSSSSTTSSSAAASTGTSSSATTSATTASGPASAGTAQITTRTLPGLGTVLVNGQGRTLYIFEPDKHAKVTCTGGCATAWPPVKLTGARATAGGGVKPALLSSDSDPAGGRVVTYHGWPLYLFAGDSSAGTANGQALNSSGGLWYVITPAGAVVTKKAGSGSGSGGSTY